MIDTQQILKGDVIAKRQTTKFGDISFVVVDDLKGNKHGLVAAVKTGDIKTNNDNQVSFNEEDSLMYSTAFKTWLRSEAKVNHLMNMLLADLVKSE